MNTFGQIRTERVDGRSESEYRYKWSDRTRFVRSFLCSLNVLSQYAFWCSTECPPLLGLTGTSTMLRAYNARTTLTSNRPISMAIHVAINTKLRLVVRMLPNPASGGRRMQILSRVN